MTQIRRRTVIAGGATSMLAFRLAHSSPTAISPNAPVVSVADFGALPNGSDAGVGVRAAIGHLPPKGGATLVFPPGTYHFTQRSGVAMPIQGIDQLTIEGNGSVFLFDGQTQPFSVQNCDSLNVQNFSIDWPRPPFSQGEVVGVDLLQRWIDVRVDPEFPVDGSEKVLALNTYDPKSGLISIGGIDAYNVSTNLTLTAPQLLRIYLTRALPLNLGDYVLLRHLVYGGSALALHGCANPNIHDIQIYAMPGMGVTAALCSDLSVQKLVISPKPGTGRWMSTTADGIHFRSCSGTVAIDNCSLTGMGDDCVNVHGTYLEMIRQIDSRTAVFGARHASKPFPANEMPPPGENFSFVSVNTLEGLGGAVLAGAQLGTTETLQFQSDIPNTAHPGDLLIDNTLRTSLTISNCRFLGNRARGVLAHSDTIIENCVFENQCGEAIQLVPNGYWMEGPAADHVVIRNNQISNVQRLHGTTGAINIGAISWPGKGPGLESDGPVNHDIQISDNEINNPGIIGISVFATAGIKITGNQIYQPADWAMILDHVQGAVIQSNTCQPAARIATRNCGPVKTEGNSGLILSA